MHEVGPGNGDFDVVLRCLVSGPQRPKSLGGQLQLSCSDRDNRTMALRLVLVSAFVLGLAACARCYPGSAECPYAVFEDVEHARSLGAFERGWLPEWLPSGATEIHEFHDLDTNAQAITFSIASVEEFNWPSECRPAKSVKRPLLETEKFPQSAHKDKSVQECDGFYAVKEEGGLVHLWRR